MCTGYLSRGKVTGAWRWSPAPIVCRFERQNKTIYFHSPSWPAWRVLGWIPFTLFRWNIQTGYKTCLENFIGEHSKLTNLLSYRQTATCNAEAHFFYSLPLCKVSSSAARSIPPFPYFLTNKDKQAVTVIIFKRKCSTVQLSTKPLGHIRALLLRPVLNFRRCKQCTKPLTYVTVFFTCVVSPRFWIFFNIFGV